MAARIGRQIPDNGITNCGDSAFGANSGCGVEQGWYNLELAAIPNAAGTDVYAGAINLYKCTLQRGHDLHARRLDQSDSRLWVQPGTAGGAGACAS